MIKNINIYELKRLIKNDKVWVFGKNGKPKLNPKYNFIGKMEISMPNVIMTASDKKKSRFKGNTCDLNNTAKNQMIDHFFDNKGKRTEKTVAFFARV